VYIPLGGSRVKIRRHIFNLFVVWALTGLWHGANATFVVWGLMYFVMLVLEKYIIKPEKQNVIIRFFYQIITLLIVNCGWILFNAESFLRAAQYSKAMVGLYDNNIIDTYTIGVVREYGVYLVLGALFSIPIMPAVMNTVEKSKISKRIGEVLIPILCMCVFIWAVSFLILGVHNPFIYFNF